MIILILFLLFLTITAGFGYVVAVVLGERRIFALVALALVFGINAYVFLVNIIGRFIYIKTAAWGVLAIMLIIALILFWVKRKELLNFGQGSLSHKQVMALFVVSAGIALACGFVAIRTLELDDLSITHLSTASTIVAGNFPVMNPSAPDYPYSFHYGDNLLTSLLNIIAKIPLWLGYDIQTALFGGLIFLMAFLLAYEITKKYAGSFLAALLLMYGGGLAWLNFYQGISPLWHRYILHQNISAPWRFLLQMFEPRYGTNIIYGLNNHSNAMGFPIILFVFYSYFKVLDASQKKKWLWATLGSIAFGYLALILETSFIIIAVALMLFPLLVAIGYFENTDGKKNFFLISFIFLVIGILLVFFQGGVLSSFGGGGNGGFRIAKFWTTPFDVSHPFILNWYIFEEFALPLALFIPAAIYFRKNWRVALLSIVALGAFVAPFLVTYVDRPWELTRIFSLAIPLFYFVSGIYWGNIVLLDWKDLISKKLLLGILLLAISSSVFIQLVYFVFPIGGIGQFHKYSFVATPSQPSDADSAAYKWIGQNTRLKDRFFPYNEVFIRDTARFTPGYYWGQAASIYPDVINAYGEIKKNCDPQSVQHLKIDYFYVGPNFPIKDFEKKCSQKLGLTLVYKSFVGGEERKIYKIK